LKYVFKVSIISREYNLHYNKEYPLKKDDKMARTNYQFEKRKKELAKIKKKEEKRQRKLDKSNTESKENPDQSPDEGENI